jgi:hypothetical protein
MPAITSIGHLLGVGVLSGNRFYMNSRRRSLETGPHLPRLSIQLGVIYRRRSTWSCLFEASARQMNPCLTRLKQPTLSRFRSKLRHGHVHP